MIIDKESSNVKVSEELVNFSNYAFFFIDSLEDEDGFTDEDFIDIDASKLDGKLINPKSFKFHHDGNIITFFSGIKNSYFFAEVFHDSKEIKSYDTIPPFGTSKVYLFKVNSDNEVALIEIKEMSYG